MVDLPAPVGPTIASLRPAGTVKSMPVQDLAVRTIAEVHALEPHLARRSIGQMRRQRRGAGTISDLALDLEQAEHLLHVHQPLLDRHVDHAEEAQRLIKLHQIGVHQHELARPSSSRRAPRASPSA